MSSVVFGILKAHTGTLISAFTTVGVLSVQLRAQRLQRQEDTLRADQHRDEDRQRQDWHRHQDEMREDKHREEDKQHAMHLHTLHLKASTGSGSERQTHTSRDGSGGQDLYPRDPLLDDWVPLPVALNQISNQITNDACVPLDLEYADTKLSDNALARSGGVLRMLPEGRPITTFEGEHTHTGTGEPLTSGGCMRSQRDWGNADERAVSNSSDEDETRADARDLHCTQRMEMILSITSTPETQHVVGTILGGEYESMVKEAEEGIVLRDGDTLMVIYAINQDTVEDGGKIVPDHRIAGNLNGQAAAMGTSLTAINIPHIPGTASPLSNIGDISESRRERK
ncbi:hypothetical protein B9Z19DRAFT_1135430 [Tuber borchii]|uniref:Uncharacterized protein n=1 Tax=Tuber borchii TaxID=42251 RepID=A0A2T6ZCV3_TUBBO|nr:hypothetical protein B9Z19DRAFT_1135430 [Tuber borchii]